MQTTSEAEGATGPPGRQDALRRFALEFPPHVVFLFVGGINAILLCVLTPPFQVHDEFQHFFRAYQLSEGRVWGKIENGRPGDSIPSSLPEFVKDTWGTLDLWRRQPSGAHPLTALQAEFKRQIQPGRREYAEFLTINYSPLLYVPQTLGIAAGRAFDLPPVALLVLGRLVNAVASVGLLVWALKALPVGREMALAVALFPMAQFEYGSVAPDATIIAAAFLLTALTLSATSRTRQPVKDIWVSALAGCVICAKVVYAPLLAIGAPAVLSRATYKNRDNTRTRFLVAQAIVFVASAFVTWLWISSVSETAFSQGQSIAIAAKISAVRAHPFLLLYVLWNDIISNGLFYYIDGIGILGAWTVALPIFVYVLATASLLLGAFCKYSEPDREIDLSVTWNVCLVALVCALIQTTIFLFGTDQPELDKIIGVQGRYFLPLGAIAAASLASIRLLPRFKAASPLAYVLLVGVLFVDTVSMDMTIVKGFALF